ncbi:MAG: CpaF family protein, partial [Acidimicrobiales bacterium]
MSLYKRLQETQTTGTLRRDTVLDEVRARVHQQLIETLGPVLSDSHIGEAELRSRVHEELRNVLASETAPMSLADRETLIRDVTDDIIGYGPIDRYLKDPAITEVMVNGPEHIYIERVGKIHKAPVTFVDIPHLRRIIDKIVSQVGRRVDESTPMVDARLPDGSRVNAVVHPLAIGGPFLTIRKFSKDPFTVSDLIEFGTLSEEVARFLEACVHGRLNVIISGGTGTGKTTLLNVMSGFLPNDERIVTIEDAK